MTEALHTPVLKHEVVKFLDPHPGERFIDATAGEGGHSLALKAKGSEVLAIDLLPRKKFIKPGNYIDIKKLAQSKYKYKGVLFDLGMSSWNLERSGRGFSFQTDQPLDMRFGEGELTAAIILNTWHRQELERIFKHYGEQRSYRQVADCVIKHRPLTTTFDLNKCLKGVKTKARIYQALRIATNNELENIEIGVKAAMEIADRVAVITYHSLEDRIIKNIFNNRLKIRPQPSEVTDNPRARSALLRLWVKDAS